MHEKWLLINGITLRFYVTGLEAQHESKIMPNGQVVDARNEYYMST